MRVVPITLIALLLLGCNEHRSVIHRQGEPDVVLFDGADAEMDAAIKAARSSFPGFAAELPSLVKRGDYTSIKVPIKTGENIEHIWLEAPKVRDGRVSGALGNAPLEGPLKLGDSVSVPIEEISDWMAVVGEELYGGYTVLVARGRMSKAEQEDFDSSAGFRVPESARQF